MDRDWRDGSGDRLRQSAPRQRHGAARAPRLAALAIVTASSLGLWAAIWYAAHSLVSLWH
jgi:hypothetical protein